MKQSVQLFFLVTLVLGIGLFLYVVQGNIKEWVQNTTEMSEQDKTVAPVVDTDGDGIPNTEDPDDDNDGISDTDEIAQNLSPVSTDTDGDGLSDPQEIKLGTGPRNRDSDRDGIMDGKEVELGLDPLSPEINFYEFSPEEGGDLNTVQ